MDNAFGGQTPRGNMAGVEGKEETTLWDVTPVCESVAENEIRSQVWLGNLSSETGTPLCRNPRTLAQKCTSTSASLYAPVPALLSSQAFGLWAGMIPEGCLRFPGSHRLTCMCQSKFGNACLLEMRVCGSPPAQPAFLSKATQGKRRLLLICFAPRYFSPGMISKQFNTNEFSSEQPHDLIPCNVLRWHQQLPWLVFRGTVCILSFQFGCAKCCWSQKSALHYQDCTVQQRHKYHQCPLPETLVHFFSCQISFLLRPARHLDLIRTI